jgi:hypothetical protein
MCEAGTKLANHNVGPFQTYFLHLVTFEKGQKKGMLRHQ